MQDIEQNIKTLVGLGISQTQAKVYLVLIEKGTLTIRAISNYSGVGRPDTYRAVLELYHLGLVETVLATPTMYKPLPLPEALSILIGHRQEEMMELKKGAVKLLEEFKIKTSEKVNDEESEFVLVPKGRAIIRRGITAIRNAESNIDCVTSFKRLNQVLLAAGEEIIDAANKGVEMRLIVERTKNTSLSRYFEELTNHPSCKIRYIPEFTHSFLAIFDRSEIQIVTSVEGDFAKAPMLRSKNAALVGVLQEYFDTIWFGQSKILNNCEENTQKIA